MAGVLSFLEGHAERALKEAEQAANRISGGLRAPIGDHKLDYTEGKHSAVPPPTFSELIPEANSTAAEMRRLDAEVEKWIDKYFPELTACLKTAPEEWLCKIITGSDPYGDSKAVLDLMWHEARDRAYRASDTERRTLDAAFSNRGFSLPPGVLVRMGVESEQRASQAISDMNRAETVRMLELKVELIKFAEEQAIKLKLGVMDALRGFYMAWISIPNNDIERAKVRAQAQAALYSSLSSYYNVEVAFEELRLKAATAEVQAQIDVDRNKIAAFSSNQSADALATAVRGFSDISATAAGAASTLTAQITTGGA